MFEILCGAKCTCTIVCSPNLLFFLLALEFFFIALHIWLALPHPQALGLSHYICSQPLDPMGIHFLCCHHGKKGQFLMMLCRMLLCLLWRMWDFMFYVKKPTFFHLLFFSLHVDGSTLWFWWILFRRWLMLSSLNPFKHI